MTAPNTSVFLPHNKLILTLIIPTNSFRLQVAKRWFDRAKSISGDSLEYSVDKFIYLWISFNAIYRDEQPMDGDKSALLGFINGNVKTLKAEDIVIIKLKKIYSEAGNEIKKGDSQISLKILTHNPAGVPIDYYYFKSTLNSTENRDKLIMIISIIYGVRNNLFHGQKMALGEWHDRDKIVLDAVCESLYSLIINLHPSWE